MVAICCHWCACPIAVVRGWSQLPCPRCGKLPGDDPPDEPPPDPDPTDEWCEGGD